MRKAAAATVGIPDKDTTMPMFLNTEHPLPKDLQPLGLELSKAVWPSKGTLTQFVFPSIELFGVCVGRMESVGLLETD